MHMNVKIDFLATKILVEKRSQLLNDTAELMNSTTEFDVTIEPETAQQPDATNSHTAWDIDDEEDEETESVLEALIQEGSQGSSDNGLSIWEKKTQREERMEEDEEISEKRNFIDLFKVLNCFCTES